MSWVSAGGRGESVLVGWFLFAMLARFGEVCERWGDAGQAASYRQRAEALRRDLEAQRLGL